MTENSQDSTSDSSNANQIISRKEEISRYFKSIRWKNEPAPPHTAYEPTLIEHWANIVTHGFYIIPVIFYCHDLYRQTRTSKEIWSSVVYSAVSIGLFSVSTIFHIIACSGHRGTLHELFHRLDRLMIYLFIAGSYTPWLSLKNFHSEAWGRWLEYAIWPISALGILYQQLFHEKNKLLSTVIYIIIGVTPALVVFEMTDLSGLEELKLGGIVYLIGVIFFKLDGRLPMAHAIWHLFVVFAAKIHFDAVDKYLIEN